MNRVLTWRLLLLTSCVAGSSHAQITARIEQARLRSSAVGLRPEAPGETMAAAAERAVPTPGDLDLGVQLLLKPKVGLRPLRVFATAHGFHTDNVGLSKNGRQSDTYLFSEIGARYEGKLSETISIEATVRQGLFRYDEFRGFNFESLNAGAGLGYKLQALGDITLFGRYNYERLTNDDLANEFFVNHTLSVGGQKSWVWKGDSLLYLGYASIFGFAEPVTAERDEHGLFGGAQLRLTERLEGDLYYRLALFDFRGGQRALNQTIVASLTYRFTQWCELNASLSFVVNRSDRSQFDYEALTTGGGIGLKLQF